MDSKKETIFENAKHLPMKNDKLLNAIKEGNKQKVEHLLNDNSYEDKSSYLDCAVQCRNVEIINLLLNHGAIVTENIFPPITHINKDILKLLLTHHGENKLTDNAKEIFLYFAVQNDLIDIVDILIDKKVDINNARFNDQTVLQLAFEKKNKDIIERLIHSDVDVHAKDEYEKTLLHYTVELLYIKSSRKILEKGADVNAVDKYGQTPLHIAITMSKIGSQENNAASIVKLLIENGADVNFKSNKTEAPLHYTALNNSTEVAKLLVENGANVNECTDLGITPLHNAVISGNEEMVKLLVENKADVNYIGRRDETPLNIAVAYEQEKIAEYLISNGAIVNHGLKQDMILHMAVFNKNANLVGLLLDNNADIFVQYNDGRSALHVAVEYKSYEITEMLLEKGANLNVTSKTGDTPLHIVVKNEDYQIFDLLLKRKPNINIKNNNGRTPLYIAAEKGYAKMVTDLLNHNPDMKENQSALHFAVNTKETKSARIVLELISRGFSMDFILSYTYPETFDFMEKIVINGHLGLAERLLKSGIDPNSPTPTKINNENFKTFLHLAVENNQLRMTKLLIDNGANVNAIDDIGNTPIFYAVKGNNYELVELLLNNGAIIDNDYQTFFMVINKGNHSIIQDFLNHFKNIDVEDEFGTTALHFAAWNGDEETVQLLLERRIKCSTVIVENLPKIRFNTEIDSNIQDVYGEDVLEDFRKNVVTTPLHIAARCNYSDILEALLEYGFDVNCRDGCGRTPLHLATLYNNTGIIDVLMEFGADLNAKDDSGSSCLDYACNTELPLSGLFLDTVFFFIYKVDSVIHQTGAKGAAEKLLMQYLAINPVFNFKIPDCCRNMKSVLIDCNFEIGVLKEKIIMNNVTFYNILTDDINVLAVYLLNEDFLKAWELELQQNKFSMYENILKKRLRRAKERKILMSEAENYFTAVLFLPELLARNIMIYLNNKDLRVVKQAYELSSINRDSKCKKS